jgi:AcrR family transcriptional regulator
MQEAPPTEQEAPRKKPGPVPRISREDVVVVARKLHAEGRLTMTAIAGELGVTVGALYRYVPDKAAILSLLAVEELDAAKIPIDAQAWPRWLDDMVRDDAAFWAEHPHMQSVAALRPPTQPGVEAMRQVLALSTEAGLDPLDAIVAMTACSYIAFGIGMGDRSRDQVVDPELTEELREVLHAFGVQTSWPEIRDRLIALVGEWVQSRTHGDG